MEAEEKRSLIRQPLHMLGGIIAEACRVYRQMRDKKLDHQEGRSLIWCLGQMRAMVETQALGAASRRAWKKSHPASKGKAMASRQQIARLGRPMDDPRVELMRRLRAITERMGEQPAGGGRGNRSRLTCRVKSAMT